MLLVAVGTTASAASGSGSGSGSVLQIVAEDMCTAAAAARAVAASSSSSSSINSHICLQQGIATLPCVVAVAAGMLSLQVKNHTSTHATKRTPASIAVIVLCLAVVHTATKYMFALLLCEPFSLSRLSLAKTTSIKVNIHTLTELHHCCLVVSCELMLSALDNGRALFLSACILTVIIVVAGEQAYDYHQLFHGMFMITDQLHQSHCPATCKCNGGGKHHVVRRFTAALEEHYCALLHSDPTAKQLQ
eukprot:17613-Heterococcus_DN1.PRE.1